MTRLSLVHVTRRYAGHTALDDVCLEVASGELLVLVGPSGCGKSTLLRVVAGLVPATEGSVRLDDVAVDDREPRERDVAMVFQSYALYPHMSCRANLAFPLKIARRPRAEIRERVQRAAELLGIAELLDRRPGTLSGGQMQRVALGRAIVRNPRVFLFDEPLSNLDAKLREEMRGEIARLHRRLGITTLYVTHDQAEAMTMGERVCVLDRGRVQQVGPPLEVYDRPANAFVATFMGSPPMNLLRGRVAGGRLRLAQGELPGVAVPPAAAAEGRELWLGVRPQAIALGGPVPARVAAVEDLGDQALITCRLLGAGLRVARPGRAEVAVGEPVGLALPPARLHWFDPADGRRLVPGDPRGARENS